MTAPIYKRILLKLSGEALEGNTGKGGIDFPRLGSFWEEVNEVVPGGDYGWPYTEGATTNPLDNSRLYTYPHGSCNCAGNAVTEGTGYYAEINQ